MTCHHVVRVLGAVAMMASLHAQTPDQRPSAFEVASVKANQSRVCNRDGSLAGGRFAMTCSTLRELITFAYQRPDGSLRVESEILAGPAWVNSDHFDVVGKPPERQGLGFDAGNTSAGSATSAQLASINSIRMMVRAFLAERFKLAVHNELRDLPVYELRVDRSDRTLGRQLTKVDVDCAAQRRGSGVSAPCGGFRMLGPGHVVAHGVSLQMLAVFLEAPVSRKVFDRTQLGGTFDVELQYAPDQPQLRRPDVPETDPTGVSIFTALREQLGLKLESTKGPVDVLVIDHVEKPMPD